jgi:hypothetical protein
MKKIFGFVFIIVVISLACNFSAGSTPSESAPAVPATQVPFTPIATLTPPTQTWTPTPPASLGPIALDFVALLCDAKWMNGGQNLAPCPDVNADHSGGYAEVLEPGAEGQPANTPILLTIPATNGFAALFLRYPSFTVHKGDRFRATLRCQTNAVCNVEYALEYYDAKGKYHSPFLSWKYKAGDAPINLDADLGVLEGQKVDFVLTLRPNNDTPKQDVGLWIAPHIYRPKGVHVPRAPKQAGLTSTFLV